jgi:hypothetical protein
LATALRRIDIRRHAFPEEELEEDKHSYRPMQTNLETVVAGFLRVHFSVHRWEMVAEREAKAWIDRDGFRCVQWPLDRFLFRFKQDFVGLVDVPLQRHVEDEEDDAAKKDHAGQGGSQAQAAIFHRLREQVAERCAEGPRQDIGEPEGRMPSSVRT